MVFSSSGFVKGLLISVFVCVLAIGGLWSFGLFGNGGSGGNGDGDDVQRLAKQAREALEAVKKRQPGDRRPASYDAVLTPLDKILRITRDFVESETFNAVGDLEKVRSMTNQVVEIATLADRQAKTETGPLAKDFRFMDQKGEALQYLAAATWERLNVLRERSTRPLEGPQPYPEKDLNDLKRLLDEGIAAAQDNRTLWYIRGVVNRAGGLFGPASRDLERCIALSPDYIPAWNTLGLVRISLKEFGGAEEAFEKAKALSEDEARRFQRGHDAEYVAIIYNLATLHENLAAYYTRENRVNPTVESRRLLGRHVTEARKYLEEFLALEPQGSPDARAAAAKLSALPRL